MKINRIIAEDGHCQVWTDFATYENWPGRTLPSGQAWWSRTAVTPGARPLLVDDPATIAELELARSQASHPSNRPARPHLTLVRDTDPTPPHGMARPA